MIDAKHVMTFGKEYVSSENFSDTENNKKMYVLRSDVSYDRGRNPSGHISLGGIKSLFDDFSGTEKNFGEVYGGKFISSISIHYFDESVNGFRKLLIHNGPNLLEDLENFISSLEGSTKNTTTIIIFHGGDLILNMNEIDIDNCLFKRYESTLPLAIFNNKDLYPINKDGSFRDFDVSYILVLCARSKKKLFDAFKEVPKLNYDSTLTNNIDLRKKVNNEIYIKINEDIPPIRDKTDKRNTKETVEFINVFGLSVGRDNDDMVVHSHPNKNVVATFGKEIKYYKEYIEIENSR